MFKCTQRCDINQSGDQRRPDSDESELKEHSQEISINGGSNAFFQGLIYALGVGVIITGNTTVTGKYFGIVANNIDVNGGANLTIPTPDYSSLRNGSPFAGSGKAYLSR